MKKKLGIFVDDANMFYAQRKAGMRIHYKRLAQLLGGVFDIQFINYHIVMPRDSDESYKNSVAHIDNLKKYYGDLLTLKIKPLKYIWNDEDKKYLKKGNVDGEIMLEAISRMDDLDAVAIMSGDSDYKILADTLISKGKEVFFIGFENTMAWELRQLHHIYLNKFDQFVLRGHAKEKAPASAGVPLLVESLYGKINNVSNDAVDNAEPHKKNLMRNFCQNTASIALALALLLAPLAPLADASTINLTVPSNPNLTSGLLLFYSFDNTKVDGKTGTVTDESGNALTGTYKKIGATSTTTATTTPGRLGQAIKFDGISASTTVGNVSSSVKSVAFWAKVATSTTKQRIIDFDGNGTNIEIASGVVTANGFTSPTIYVDGVSGATTLNDTKWHHVVVTTGTNVNASNMNLGVASSTYFGGTLDDLRVYNRALSTTDITRLYHLGATSYVNLTIPSNTSLKPDLLFYSFDNTKVSGSTITDESGSGKNGTPLATPGKVVVFLTSGTSWVAPSGVTSVDVETIGGGGRGTAASNGGGGGAYSKQTSITVIPGTNYTIAVGLGGTSDGANGGDTYFNGASCAGASVCAKGGLGTGAGGAAASGVGATKNSGGAGGNGGGSSDGAGGAGGPLGTGGNGGSRVSGNTSSGGGGGNGGGTAGANSVSDSVGGAGGNNNGGTGGGAGGNNSTGSNGTNGGGGGGGGSSVGAGGKGGNGTEFDSTHGSGGGGGGSFGNNNPGTGGLYGGGGGISGTASANGGNGLIVVKYTSTKLAVPGRIGQAINFDGVMASTTIGNVSSSVKSVAFWVKVATSTTKQRIMDFNGNGTNIEIASSVVTANGFTSPTIYIDGVSGATTLNDTKWHHVVVTTGTVVNASNVNLGVASSTYFGGTLDDLRIYSRALSSSDITRLYQLGATSYVNTTSIGSVNKNNANGLVGWWTFDGANMGPTVKDTSGNGDNGTLSGFTSTTTAPGALGQALKFTTGQTMTMPGSALDITSNTMTIAMWYRRATTTAGSDFVARGTPGSNGYEYGLGISPCTIDQFKMTKYAIADICAGTAPEDTKWHHAVAVWDSVGERVYIDGAQSAGTAADTSNFITSSNSAVVGSGAMTFDDIRIYNRALSAAEVKRLYHLGN